MIKMQKFFKLLAIVIVITCLFVTNSCSGKKEKPHILLITVDGMRPDHMSAYGYPRETTPYIAELAKKGVLFKYVVTPLPAVAAGNASILTSRHPVTHQLFSNGLKLKEKVQTIAEVYQKNGYFTMGAVSMKILDKERKFNQGFDVFADDFKGWERETADVNRDLLAKLPQYFDNKENSKKPLFIWIHYTDVKAPHLVEVRKFSTPIDKAKIGKNSVLAHIIPRYDSEINAVDNAIKEVHDYLEKRKVLKDTATCITSALGEQHGEHGLYNICGEPYSETIFTPLIFSGNGMPEGKTEERWVSVMDVSATLLQRCGFAFDNPSDGINLFEKDKEKAEPVMRDFLVLADPLVGKSVMLIQPPYAYALNHDNFYNEWYISNKAVLPAKEMDSPRKDSVWFRRTPTENQLGFFVPEDFTPGQRYLALNMQLEEKNPNKVLKFIFNHKLRTRVEYNEKAANLTILYPTSTLDGNTLYVEMLYPLDTRVSNLKYGILNRKQVKVIKADLQIMPNEIFTQMTSKRKDSSFDELFDITADPGMMKNLLLVQTDAKLQGQINTMRQTLFNLYKKYWSNGMKMYGRNVPLVSSAKEFDDVLNALNLK